MPTIQQQLNQLKADKATLNTMLNTMGVETTGNETFTQLAPLVGKIVTDPILQDKAVEITENGTTTITADSGYDGLNNVEVTTNVAGGGGGKYAPRWIRFSNYTGTELNEEIANLDTSNLTSMNSMFNTCSNLTTLNLSKFDTSKVTNMASLFYSCGNLTSLNLSNFNTSKVTTMQYMFRQCSNLTSLDLSSFDTSKVYNMDNMFYGCKNLNHLDIRNFNFSAVSSSGNMFSNVPANCEIIVKDDSVRNWVLGRRSDFTNVKTIAELG